MALSDEDLVKRCAEGDQGAFLALHDRFAPRVFGLVLKLLGDRSESEDVLQEVMWEAWTRADRYNQALGSVATWLLMIARSRAIDAVRKHRAGGAASIAATGAIPDDLPSQPAAPPAEPATGAEVKLRDALDSLPPEQRAVISMAFYRGLTREEIAEALNIPVGTVKTRIRLGVRRLAEQKEQFGLVAP